MENKKIARFLTIGAFIIGQLLLFLVKSPAYIQIAFALLFVAVLYSRDGLGYIFIYRVVTPVVIGIVFLTLYHYVYNIDFLGHILRASFRVSFMLDKFFNVVSTLYAITIAFLLWKGLSDYDNLKTELNNEASMIRNIINYTEYFENENKEIAQNIKSNLKKYIENIFTGDRIRNHKDNDKVLSDCIKHISIITPHDFNDEVAISEIMKSISDLSKIRSVRQSYIETKMSPYLLLAIGVMSIFIMYPLFTKSPAEGGAAASIMVFSMSTLLSFMFITLFDIRDPFSGFWKIKLDAFKEIMEYLDMDIHKIEKSIKIHEKHGRMISSIGN